MVIMSGAPLYSIVNGSQLAGFVGRKVAVCGIVNSASIGDKTFSMRSTDNIVIPVELNKPLTENINGYIQVKGMCQPGKTIKADQFYVFANEKFDAKSHNKLCVILNSLPNAYSAKNH